MVIMNSIDERGKSSTTETNENRCPYVYLVDNEQQMLLILKNKLGEMSGNRSTVKPEPIEEFITQKVQSLLKRVSDNGPLSLREIEVLNFAAMGKSNKQIANVIGLSESTIKNHFSSTLRKLHANDRTHAVTLALCNGWLNVENLSNTVGKNEF